MDETSETTTPQFFASLGMASVAWAHRMGNTLGLIPVIVQRIRMDPDNRERLLTSLDQIEEAVREQLAFIETLTKFSRLSSDSHVEPLEVNSIIQRTLKDHYERLANRIGAPQIELSLASDLPYVRANDQLLGEVIRNLVDNSLKAVSGSNVALVEIRTHLVDGKVAIEVKDNGPGIPSDIATKMFRRPISKTQSSEGLGLGLLVSRALVDSWGGRLDLVTSDDTSGTTMCIVLNPWQAPAIIDTARHALVLENDELWAELLRDLLLERGLVVDMATSHGEATRLIEVTDYDLALLDLRAFDDNDPSDQTGINFARLLRERNPEMLIVMQSGFPDVHALREAQRAGVDEFLYKSDIKLDQIDKIIDRVAVRRETERESIRQSQLNKLMYEVLSMISHELRTPLVTIQRNAEALSDGTFGSLTREQSEAVEIIRSAVRREFLLLNAHLDLNRIERGAERMHYQEYDLVALMNEEVLAHRPEADSKGVSLKAFLPKKKAIVNIDVNRFRVALNPLMDNSIKFSPEGGEVAVRVTLSDDYVEVLVTDHGPGIKPAELDQLLNWRDMETVDFTQRIRSSGLGLSMAKRMIDLHDGKLWVESDGKSGTTVGFRLPIRK